jgi:hypothetical protein
MVAKNEIIIWATPRLLASWARQLIMKCGATLSALSRLSHHSQPASHGEMLATIVVAICWQLPRNTSNEN